MDRVTTLFRPDLTARTSGSTNILLRDNGRTRRELNVSPPRLRDHVRQALHTPFHLTGLSEGSALLTLPIFALFLLVYGHIIPQFPRFVNGFSSKAFKGKLFTRYKIP